MLQVSLRDPCQRVVDLLIAAPPSSQEGLCPGHPGFELLDRIPAEAVEVDDARQIEDQAQAPLLHEVDGEWRLDALEYPPTRHRVVAGDLDGERRKPL